MTNIINADTKILDELYNNSAYTIIGAGGDLNEWINGYNNILKKEDIGTVDTWYTFSGKLVNNKYNLEDRNRFQDDVTFLAFRHNNLNIGKLAIFKIKMEDRWFDDLIDNSVPSSIFDDDEEDY